MGIAGHQELVSVEIWGCGGWWIFRLTSTSNENPGSLPRAQLRLQNPSLASTMVPESRSQTRTSSPGAQTGLQNVSPSSSSAAIYWRAYFSSAFASPEHAQLKKKILPGFKWTLLTHTCLEAEASRSHSDWETMWKTDAGGPAVGHCQPTAILLKRVLQSAHVLLLSGQVLFSSCPITLPGYVLLFTHQGPCNPRSVTYSTQGLYQQEVCLWPAQMGGTSPPSPAALPGFALFCVGWLRFRGAYRCG